MRLRPHPLRRRRVFLLAALAVALPAAIAAAQAPAKPDPDAAKALEAVVRAYRSAPAIEVTSKVRITLHQGEASAGAEERTARFIRVKDGPGIVEINDFRCHFLDGRISVTHEKNEDAYFAEDYDGKPYWALLLLFQDLPFPHTAILFGEDEPADNWMMLAPKTPWIAPTRLATVTIDGKAMQRIVLSSDNGSLEITVDPKTKLVNSMRHEITGGQYVEAGSRIVAEYAIEATLHQDGLPAEQVAFEPGGRQRVDVLSVLPPRIVADAPPAQQPGMGGEAAAAQPGQPAPPFTLATLDGDAVDLADYRGKAMVIDFWATWCPPCRAALPELHNVANWARQEDLPVSVLTINVSERADGPDAWIRLVREFWTGQRFTLPVALDFSGDVMRDYGVGSIPTTLVIGPDGVIRARHEGYDAANYVRQLKNDIRSALAGDDVG